MNIKIYRLRVETLDFIVGRDDVTNIELDISQIGEYSSLYRYCVSFKNGNGYSVNVNHPYVEIWYEQPEKSKIEILTKKLKKK